MKKLFTLGMLAGVALLCAQCQTNNSPAKPSQQMKPTQQNTPTQAMNQDDVMLMNTIKDMLQKKFPGKYGDLVFVVSNGKVTIQGNVATQQESDAIEKAVGLIGPVRSVNNQLKVQGK